ncbi:MAG TPA: calcium-binding protein [Paracoccus sp. (in: a-proteobacteria)]|nr:calcium-binding protein [Paracoccus sp. (in: a-proteobacteria)]
MAVNATTYAASGRIDTGTTRSGSISFAGEYDTYTTTLIEGLTYSAAAKGASSGNGTLYDPNIALYDRNGTRLLDNDDVTPGSNRDGVITFRIGAGGTDLYTLGVGETGNNATGSYRLTLSAGYATGANDSVTGTGYNDAINGMNGNDRIWGMGGHDNLLGAAGNDWLMGGGGADVLQGGVGADVLRGQGGNDVLYGAHGADDLYGGTGADRFVFYSHTDSNAANGIDVIAAADGAIAFEGVGVTGGDRIDLSGIDANLGVAGNQAFVFSTSHAAGTLSLLESGGQTILQGHVNNDGVADFTLAIADGATTPYAYSADEFIL